MLFAFISFWFNCLDIKVRLMQKSQHFLLDKDASLHLFYFLYAENKDSLMSPITKGFRFRCSLSIIVLVES